jgi:hypothetical protein
MKLTKLAWDLLGSDFAGRHLQYEKFYAGPSFVMNSYSYLAAPWKDWTGVVDELMAGMTHDARTWAVVPAKRARLVRACRRPQNRHQQFPKSPTPNPGTPASQYYI